MTQEHFLWTPRNIFSEDPATFLVNTQEEFHEIPKNTFTELQYMPGRPRNIFIENCAFSKFKRILLFVKSLLMHLNKLTT